MVELRCQPENVSTPEMKISRPFHLVTAPVSQTVRIWRLAGLGQGIYSIERKYDKSGVQFFFGVMGQASTGLRQYAGMRDGMTQQVVDYQSMLLVLW